MLSHVDPFMLFNSSFSVKDLLHFEQANCFSLQWILSWFFKAILCIKWLRFLTSSCVGHFMHFQMTYSTEKNGTYSISLIKHVLLHNGEKHYFCSRCDKTLKHRNDLKNISWNVIWCFRAHLLRQVSHFEFGSFLRKGSWQ